VVLVLVLGKRGSGKSGLGYRLLELFRYVAHPYVVGVPQAARSLLPDWIGIAPSLEEAPPKSIVLIDEAYLAYHARGSMARQSKAMSQQLNLSRQRQQTLIFVSQEARQVDRNIASSANVVIFKDLGILQLEFDRPEINKLAAQAKEGFAGVTGDKRGWAYVYAPDHDFQGLLENALPSFWKPSLSRLFAIEAPPAAPRAAKAMTPQEKASRAKELRASGASYSQIAEALGVTRGTVVNYLKGYPYRG
jgi:DNA-binding CsgD family transcriptional regulator